MTHWLIGSSGLLGTGYLAALRHDGIRPIRVSLPWQDADGVASALLRQFEQAAPALDGSVVVWAAGVGGVSSAPSALVAESEGIRALCEAVRRMPPSAARSTRIAFASSAGALFAGYGDGEIDESTAPVPTGHYGHEKLRQETALRDLTRETGCTVLACRYSNLYGLAQGRLTPRGLVSTAVRATRLRQPMTVFVSPDTRRDYVYNADAGALSLRGLQEARPGFGTLLVRDGQTRTVAEVLSLVGRVSGRRVPATYGDRLETRLQPRVLRFTHPPRGPGLVRRTPMEAAIHRMMRAPMLPM